MDNSLVIRTLTLQGTSLIKLYKFLPEGSIKAVPDRTPDIKKYDLQVDISGVLFNGTDDNSNISISSFNRSYTEEELVALQKMASKCYTYPFGGFGFFITLNILANDKTLETVKALLTKHMMEHPEHSLDSEYRIVLNISDIKDLAKPSFIDFILELQDLKGISG